MIAFVSIIFLFPLAAFGSETSDKQVHSAIKTIRWYPNAQQTEQVLEFESTIEGRSSYNGRPLRSTSSPRRPARELTI